MDWTKSTYSGMHDCVEWRKSSRSFESDCVEFHISSYCNVDGCIAVHAGETIQVRDSKDPEGPILNFTPESWTSFINGVKEDQFATRVD
jgi:hypothetical protein